MAAVYNRDIVDLRREDLLDDYFAIAKRRGGALVASALRTRSVTMRDILAHGATHTNMTSEQIKNLLLSGADVRENIADIDALEELGRLVMLQNILEQDAVYGEKLFTLANEMSQDHQLSIKNLRVLIQHHILNGNLAEAAKLLDSSPQIDTEMQGYLRAEFDNPFTLGSIATTDEWLDAFNRVFAHHKLAPISLTSDKELMPFDRLAAPLAYGRRLVADNELVSVVMTVFRPNIRRFVTSVESILRQTWTNLELVIVNDGSGPEYDEIFAYVNELDKRVIVKNAAENRGTYAARNIGYAASRGSFITGQDDDDWSHPERIERQVKYLRDNSKSIGCRVNGIMCDENLGRVRLGYKPVGPNASSLMIRREGYEMAGGFLEARKAADTEYFYRVARCTNKSVHTLPDPLSIVRILSDSLSRSDFGPGWRHQSRRSFRSSYEFWHRSSSSVDLFVGEKQSSVPVKIPRRFRVSEDASSRPSFDVIFAGDWQSYGGPQKSMLEEIYALARLNYRIGILNLEAGRFMSISDSATLNDEIQHLLNSGFVDEVFYDEAVHSRLLVLRYPPILQFLTHDSSNIAVDSMVILANQAPSELDGTDIRYIVRDCHRNAQRAFGVSPLWVPQGPQVRKYLENYLSVPTLAEFDIPGILDLNEWWHDRLWFRSMKPVVGRHSRDDVMKWPVDRTTLVKVYPIDGQWDVRIMGGTKTPLKVLGLENVPSGWIVYEKDEQPVPAFLHAIDYFVFYQHPQAVEAFGRAILEALASGTVVILPEHFREVFGDAALYSEPKEVANVISRLHSDFSLYKEQLAISKAVLTRDFSYDSYQKLIQNMLLGHVV